MTAGQELRKDARAILVSLSERLVLHLVRQDRVGQMILLEEGRRRRVEEGVDVPNGPVRAVALLQIDGRRM